MENPTVGRPIEILLVEDNPADVRLTVESLKEGKVCNILHVAEDGEEAISFLQKKGKYADKPSNCYITKPVDLDQFIHVIKSVNSFWFSIVKLPPHKK